VRAIRSQRTRARVVEGFTRVISRGALDHSFGKRGDTLTMPRGGTDPTDVLLFIITIIVSAGLIIVVGGGALEAWRSWSDNRRIRKHLRN
jgi:hypothetical protein